MTNDGGVEYASEWTTVRGLPARSRLRFGLTKEAGTPIRFLVQLEYWHDGEWLEVARFDHDRTGPTYRNVHQAGLHVDVYHPEQGQIAKRTVSDPLPAKQAMADAEEYIRNQAEPLIQRFEGWL